MWARIVYFCLWSGYAILLNKSKHHAEFIVYSYIIFSWRFGNYFFIGQLWPNSSGCSSPLNAVLYTGLALKAVAGPISMCPAFSFCTGCGVTNFPLSCCETMPWLQWSSASHALRPWHESNWFFYSFLVLNKEKSTSNCMLIPLLLASAFLAFYKGMKLQQCAILSPWSVSQW